MHSLSDSKITYSQAQDAIPLPDDRREALRIWLFAHRRNITLTSLAALLGVTHSALSQALGKERMSIARAMYTRPALLIFDEATSALDQANENSIQQTIERLADNVTCVIIAHRLTTVERCDTLIWLDKGRIVMEGPTRRVLDAYQRAQAAPQRP